MRRVVYIVLLLSVMLCAYTYDGYCYMSVECTLGQETLVLPVSALHDTFSLDDSDLPINITQSNITGYILSDNGERVYRVTIPPYGETWSYRLFDGSDRTSDFVVTSIIDSNINFLTMESISAADINYDLIIIVCVLIGGVLCFMRT